MVKIADSAAIRQNIAVRPRAGSSQLSSGLGVVMNVVFITGSCYSYFQSGSDGCFRSQSGRRLLTTGTTGKFHSGGGELVDHSSVHASQGSLPAVLPLK